MAKRLKAQAVNMTGITFSSEVKDPLQVRKFHAGQPHFYLAPATYLNLVEREARTGGSRAVPEIVTDQGQIVQNVTNATVEYSATDPGVKVITLKLTRVM